MDYLQYTWQDTQPSDGVASFKPYYKWITFNTVNVAKLQNLLNYSFKPYYKWITFNTERLGKGYYTKDEEVLNLIINGLPSILNSFCSIFLLFLKEVLNLIINGLPSIQQM